MPPWRQHAFRFRSSVDSQDSNREEHPGADYGDSPDDEERSSDEPDSDSVDDSDDDDPGMDEPSAGHVSMRDLRGRAMRELSPYLGKDAALRAVCGPCRDDVGYDFVASDGDGVEDDDAM